MTRTEELNRRFGSNIGESIGVTKETQPAPDFGKPVQGEKYSSRSPLRNAASIDLKRIVPDPDQPRKEFDEASLTDLKDSIAKIGLLQPIRVRWKEELNRWVIVSGERRFRACKLAGLKRIPCMVVDDDQTAEAVLVDQLVENSQREGLRPLEQANAYQRLIDLTGWSHRQLAEAVSTSKSNVTKSLSLLGLPGDVRQQVDSGTLPLTAAYALSRIRDTQQKQELAEEIVDRQLTRDAAVRLIQQKTKPTSTLKTTDVTIRKFQLDGGTIQVTLRMAGASDQDIAQLLLSAMDQLQPNSHPVDPQ